MNKEKNYMYILFGNEHFDAVLNGLGISVGKEHMIKIDKDTKDGKEISDLIEKKFVLVGVSEQ